MTLPLTGAGPSAGGGYSTRVLGYSPIAYWPQWEASGTAAVCQVNAAQNGTYTGVTLGQDGIGDGRTCPLFDGTNDLNNIYTTVLRDAFNGAEGTVLAWAKVSRVGVWTDSTYRSVLALRVDASNRVRLQRTTTNNQLEWRYVALDSLSTVGWFHMGLTWSASGNAVKAYYAGSQTGTTQSGLGTWAGSLGSTTTVIGARSSIPNDPWDGYLAHVAIWSSALADATIADLAVV